MSLLNSKPLKGYPDPEWFGKLWEGLTCSEIQEKWLLWKPTEKLPSVSSEAGRVEPLPVNHLGVDAILNSNTKPTNPKDSAATNRLDLSVVPQSSIITEALAWVEGDCKYGAYNYREMGVSVSVYIAACLRHIFKMYNGEWADPQTRVPHLGNAKACLGAIIDGFEHGNIVDDRPPAQNIGQQLKDAEEIVKHLHKTFPNGPARYTEVKKNVAS